MRAAIFGLSVLALQWGSDDVEAVGSTAYLSRTNHEGARREGQASGLGTAPTVDVVSQGVGKPATAAGVAHDGTIAEVKFPQFTCTNEYDPIEGSPWEYLAEPFRETTLEASSTVGDSERNVFMWAFDDDTVLEGTRVTHVFNTLGRQRIVLSQIDVLTGEMYLLEADIMVKHFVLSLLPPDLRTPDIEPWFNTMEMSVTKYVRREIRQLTDTDREAFFRAMETLYRLPTEEGKEEYGDEYKGIHYFVQLHLNGAGVKECDHWHDDAGIMTHHIGYTLLFEQALQVVDPMVSIPYWEYTIESAMGFNSYGQSEVFADDWFGAASPDNPMHIVERGRWAYLPVMADAWEHVHNSFGLLRSPWNADSTPFVTRHNTTNGKDNTAMVSCEKYEDCFGSTNMSAMNNCLNGRTHGPVHILIGGEWGNPEESFTDSVGYSNMVPLISKFLWRKGYLRVPDTCSVKQSGAGDESTCRASCPEELYKTRGMTPYDVLMDVSAIHWFAETTKGAVIYDKKEDHFHLAGDQEEDVEEAFWKKVLDSLCDPGHVGDMFTSSAPYDPLFWVIHPTAERLLAWRRKLGNEQAEEWLFDETWGYDHGQTVGETGTVCDWSAVREGTLDMPTCTKDVCGGHNPDDILPFKIKVHGETRMMSNTEWFDFIYPDNEDLPYIYNQYRWDHCTADGAYNLGSL